MHPHKCLFYLTQLTSAVGIFGVMYGIKEYISVKQDNHVYSIDIKLNSSISHKKSVSLKGLS